MTHWGAFLESCVISLKPPDLIDVLTLWEPRNNTVTNEVLSDISCHDSFLVIKN